MSVILRAESHFFLCADSRKFNVWPRWVILDTTFTKGLFLSVWSVFLQTCSRYLLNICTECLSIVTCINLLLRSYHKLYIIFFQSLEIQSFSNGLVHCDLPLLLFKKHITMYKFSNWSNQPIYYLFFFFVVNPAKKYVWSLLCHN